MFKNVELLKNIEYFSIQQSSLIYKYRDDNIIYLDKAKLPNEYKYYGYLDKNFIQYGVEEKHYLRDIERNEVFETPKVLLSQGFNGKSGFYSGNYTYNKEIRRSLSDLFKFNISTGTSTKILSNSPEILRLVENQNLFLFLPRTILKSLSLLTGEYEWETALNRNGEIFKILDVRENELVVCWKRGVDLYGLLGINIKTGEIVWNIDDNALLNGLSLYFTENSIFSTKGDGKSSYYIEIDFTTKKIVRYGEIFDLCKNNWVISHSQYRQGKVYFAASTHHVFFPNILGVFDFESQKLLWHHQFSFDKHTHLKNFEISDEKLYVLDSTDTLHIFERESPPQT